MVTGDDVIPYVCELPADLFDILLTYLPPLALQKLQTKMLVIIFLGGGGLLDFLFMYDFYVSLFLNLLLCLWAGHLGMGMTVDLLIIALKMGENVEG